MNTNAASVAYESALDESTITSVIPPPSATMPSTAGTSPKRRGGTADSTRALPGRAASARLAASRVASTATTTPTATASAYGTHDGLITNPSGASPTEISARVNAPNKALAARQPAPPASKPIAALSRSSILRTCPGVAPIARTSAI